MTCGEGQQTRTRTCSHPSPLGYGEGCVGDLEESRACNEGPCVPVVGVDESKYIDASTIMILAECSRLSYSTGLSWGYAIFWARLFSLPRNRNGYRQTVPVNGTLTKY